MAPTFLIVCRFNLEVWLSGERFVAVLLIMLYKETLKYEHVDKLSCNVNGSNKNEI